MEGIKYQDPNRLGLIELLRKEGKSQPLYRRIADDLGKSRKNRSEVNLDKISQYTKPTDVAVIAGKVLANGELTHEVTIACFKISETAKEKVESSKGKVITIKELLQNKPKGRIVILK